ncbi:MAG: inorganic diphosphatase [Clostridia bacterium]|nr:inorganic diphosphatase [Clostridia bacterium]
MQKIIDAIIEIPMNTINKYEIDKPSGRIRLSRVLYSRMTYPAEYGYIESTLALDGDPLDILVLASEKTFPGCIVSARVLGYLDMVDMGFQDEKVIAVVDADPRFEGVKSLEDVHPHILKEIKHFFQTYKHLQETVTTVNEYHGIEETLELIESCIERYKEQGDIKEKNDRVF